MTCSEMHKAEQKRAGGRRLVVVVWMGVGERLALWGQGAGVQVMYFP